jgi:IS5 family transposase
MAYCLPVPRHDAFHRGFNRLTPETLKAINDLVVQAAVELGLEDGRVEAMVVGPTFADEIVPDERGVEL